MSVVSQYVINSLVEEHHPALNSETCLNKKQKRVPCTICKDICPNDVFQQIKGEEPKWTQCNNCNLCTSACPGRCLTPSTDTLKPWLTGYDDSGIVRIGCSSAMHRLKLEEYCVASLPWEFIAYLALKMKVYLYLPCSDCPDEMAADLVDKHLENLKHFLGEKLFKARIIQIHSDADIPEDDAADRTVTRNELFSLWKSQVANQAFKAIAEVNVTDYDGLFYRRMLADYTKTLSDAAKEKGQRTVFSVKLPHMNSKCYTCDVCQRLCPTQAISFGEVKDGKRGIYITPWKCTGCGICKTACRDHGLDEIEWTNVPHLQKLLLTKVNVKLCTECGRAMKPDHADELCTFCRTKLRMQEKKEAAQAKADAQKAAREEAVKAKSAAEAQSEITANAVCEDTVNLNAVENPAAGISAETEETS